MKTSFILLFLLVASLVSAQNTYKIKECVIENGAMKLIDVDYDAATGNKSVMINGKKMDFETAYSIKGTYAASENWFINNEEINYNGKLYSKYGLPRVLGPEDITKTGSYKGIGLYTETGISGVPEVFYVPVRLGCEFQPYAKVIPKCGKLTISKNVKDVKISSLVTINANLAEATQPVTYEWRVYGGELIGSETSKSIKVKTVDFQSSLDVSVIIKGKNCISNESLVVPIIK